MSELIRRKHSQPQFASSPLLPDEQVLWEGYGRRITVLYWAILISSLLFSIAVIVLFFSIYIFRPDLSMLFWLLLFNPLNWYLVLALIANRNRYILTSERLIIMKKPSNRWVSVNCNFSQLLAVKLKHSFYIPYIELITPYRDIPSRLYPTKNHQELYDALEVLVQFIDLSEKN